MEFLKDIVSSNVKAVKYNPTTNRLFIQFLQKKDDDRPQTEYIYEEVKKEEFQLLKEAESVGSTLHTVIKGKKFIKTEISEIE